jgi:hypothetical protein
MSVQTLLSVVLTWSTALISRLSELVSQCCWPSVPAASRAGKASAGHLSRLLYPRRALQNLDPADLLAALCARERVGDWSMSAAGSRGLFCGGFATVRGGCNRSIQQSVGGVGGTKMSSEVVDLRNADGFGGMSRKGGISRLEGIVTGVSLMQANGHHES